MRHRARVRVQLGKAAQVEPMEPRVKAHGTKRLKQKHDEPLSNFAFNLNLRRYNWGLITDVFAASAPFKVGPITRST